MVKLNPTDESQEAQYQQLLTRIIDRYNEGRSCAMEAIESSGFSVNELFDIPEPDLSSDTAIYDQLKQFFLNLDRGFGFIGQQYRITVNNAGDYWVDLVFYHRILKCFVLIDLKINEVQHQDIGQMNLYMGYFANEENMEDDNPPIGIILTRSKDELLVEYATYQMNSQLFVQKYQLYLPNEEELRRELSWVWQREKRGE